MNWVWHAECSACAAPMLCQRLQPFSTGELIERFAGVNLKETA